MHGLNDIYSKIIFKNNYFLRVFGSKCMYKLRKTYEFALIFLRISTQGRNLTDKTS